MIRIVLALCLLLSGPAGAATTHRITTEDEGGLLIHYVAKYEQWRKDGDSVIVDGNCNSACTLMLGVLDKRSMCATRFGAFGFHSALNGEEKYTLDGTRFMWSFYRGRPARVLARHGWPGPSEHPKLLMIAAGEILQSCPRGD